VNYIPAELPGQRLTLGTGFVKKMPFARTQRKIIEAKNVIYFQPPP
jgi:hypothetical protein